MRSLIVEEVSATNTFGSRPCSKLKYLCLDTFFRIFLLKSVLSSSAHLFPRGSSSEQETKLDAPGAVSKEVKRKRGKPSMSGSDDPDAPGAVSSEVKKKRRRPSIPIKILGTSVLGPRTGGRYSMIWVCFSFVII